RQAHAVRAERHVPHGFPVAPVQSDFLAPGYGPDPHRPVRAGRGQALPGGVEDHAENVAAVSGERLHQLAGGRVPQPDEARTSTPTQAGSEVTPVGAKLHAVHWARVGLEGQRFGARGDVPDPYLTWEVPSLSPEGAGQAAAIRAERHTEGHPL